MSEINTTIPSLILNVERSIANFLNQQGNQKMYYLLDSIECLKNYSIVFFGQEKTEKLVNSELNKITIKKMSDYKGLSKYLSKIRRKLNYATILYENMKKTKDKILKKKYERQIADEISPFQDKLYLIFFIFLKSSGLSDKTVSRDLLRSPEESIINQKSFEKKKVKEEVK